MTLPGLPKSLVSHIDCAGCRACCRGGMVVILEDGDDDSRGDWDWKTYGLVRVRQIKHKRNGDCVHLGPRGCEIYESRPKICRAFDCTEFVRDREWLATCDNEPMIREAKRRLALGSSK